MVCLVNATRHEILVGLLILAYQPNELFASETIFLMKVIFFSFRFLNALVYYGVSFSTPTLGGNMYLNFFLSSVIEIPANYVAIWSLGR